MTDHSLTLMINQKIVLCHRFSNTDDVQIDLQIKKHNVESEEPSDEMLIKELFPWLNVESEDTSDEILIKELFPWLMP